MLVLDRLNVGESVGVWVANVTVNVAIDRLKPIIVGGIIALRIS